MAIYLCKTTSLCGYIYMRLQLELIAMPAELRNTTVA